MHTNSRLKQDVLIIGNGLKESAACVVVVRDVMHYLTQCQNSMVISRGRAELLEPLHKKWKGIHKLTQIELTNPILACQNDVDDMLSETGHMSKIPRSF